jgi:hypothetical protein
MPKVNKYPKGKKFPNPVTLLGTTSSRMHSPSFSLDSESIFLARQNFPAPTLPTDSKSYDFADFVNREKIVRLCQPTASANRTTVLLIS